MAKAVTAYGTRLIFSGESYKGGCGRTDSTFFTVAVVVMSKECPSLVWVGFLGVVSDKVLLVYSQQV